MELVLATVAPVFGLVLIGWTAARCGVFEAEATRGLSLFVFNFAIPVMIARTMAMADLGHGIEWQLLLAYFGSAAVAYALGMLVGAKLFGRSLAEQGVFGVSACFSNSLVMGTPIVMGAFGDGAAVPFFLILAFHSPILMTLTSVVIETGRNQGVPVRTLPWTVLRSLIANPILGGIAVGLAMNVLDVMPPGPFAKIAELLAQAALPCALFALGANLARFRFGSRLREAAALATLKTLVQPALVLLACWIVGTGPLSTRVAVVVAAMPAGINSYLFAARYELAVAEASTTIVVSTLVSAVTLSLLLVLLA